MRHVAIVISVGILAALAGCSSTRWGFVKNDDRQTPLAGSNEVPTSAQLVAWMNDNADRIKSLRVEDLDMTCTQGQGLTAQSGNVRGKMVTEKPLNFRLGASALGNQVVDLGSNDQEFWYWISKANPPYQVYCSHKDLKEGRVRQMPFPFQPEWVMESMGLGPYGPPEKYTVEHDAQTIKLVEKSVSAQGTPVRKVIVITRKSVPTPKVPGKAYPAKVTDYLLLEDASGKEICGAHISEVQLQVQLDQGKGAIVPKRMELRWPSEKLTLALRMDGITVNGPTATETFMRRTSPNIQSFNLARMQEDNSPPPNAISGIAPKITPAQAFAPQ